MGQGGNIPRSTAFAADAVEPAEPAECAVFVISVVLFLSPHTEKRRVEENSAKA